MSLAKLLKECPTALAVYLLLLGKGRVKVYTNRKKLAAELSIKKLDTITIALRYLKAAKLLDCQRNTSKNSNNQLRCRGLKITLRSSQFSQHLFHRVNTRSNGSGGRVTSFAEPPLERVHESAALHRVNTRSNGAHTNVVSMADGFTSVPPPPTVTPEQLNKILGTTFAVSEKKEIE